MTSRPTVDPTAGGSSSASRATIGPRTSGAPVRNAARPAPRVRQVRPGRVSRLREWLHTDAGRQRSTAALIVLIWSWVFMPTFLSSLVVPKRRATVGADDTVHLAAAQKLTTLLVLLVLLTCVVIIALLLDDLPRTRGVAVCVLLIPWAYMIGRGLYLGERPRRLQLVYPLVVIAFWVLRPRIAQLRTLGYLVGITAVVAVAMGWLLPSRGLFQSAAGVAVVTDKQIFSSGILAGPFDKGNTLAQFLIMGVPAIGLIPRRRLRWFLLFMAAYALLWAAARSCLVALVLTVVMAITMAGLPVRLRPLVGCLGLGGLVGAIVALPLLTTDPTAFTNRGYIWHVSLEAWRVQPIVGRGTNFYAEIAGTSANLGPTVFHGHNQFVQLLVSGGVVYVALFAVLLAYVTSVAARLVGMGVRTIGAATTSRYENAFGMVFLTAFLGACLLETSFAMVDRTFLVPTMTVPFAVLAVGRTGNEPNGHVAATNPRSPSVTKPMVIGDSV